MIHPLWPLGFRVWLKNRAYAYLQPRKCTTRVQLPSSYISIQLSLYNYNRVPVAIVNYLHGLVLRLLVNVMCPLTIRPNASMLTVLAPLVSRPEHYLMLREIRRRFIYLAFPLHLRLL